MKKLGKLSINPEKLMKNEELVNLRGGYGDHMSKCYCYCGSQPLDENLCGPVIVGGSPGFSGCVDDCDAVYGPDNVTAACYTDLDMYGC